MKKEDEAVKKEIKKLKRDVQVLKHSIPLNDDILELKNAIRKLINIFDTAAQSIRAEEKEAEVNAKDINNLKKLNSKIDKIMEENSLIAQVIIKLHDNITDLQGMFSEFDDKLKTILRRTYVKIPHHAVIPSVKGEKDYTDKKITLERFKREFSG